MLLIFEQKKREDSFKKAETGNFTDDVSKEVILRSLVSRSFLGFLNSDSQGLVHF